MKSLYVKRKELIRSGVCNSIKGLKQSISLGISVYILNHINFLLLRFFMKNTRWI